jgi:hypothetical protein
MTAQELAGMLLQHPTAEVSIEALDGNLQPDDWPVTGVSLVAGRMVIS